VAAMNRGHRPTGGCAGLALSADLLRWRVAVALVVAGVCGVLLVGASGAVPAAEATVAPHRITGARIAWKGCGKRLQCARVRVPLDWARPGLGTISLAVVRYLASRPGQRIGSLFVNYGGPGVAGVPAVKAGGAELDKLGDGRFDVVGWDPRGVGESTQVRCFANDRAQTRFWGRRWSIPATRQAAVRYLPKALAFVKRCVALSGPLLTHDSTADTPRSQLSAPAGRRPAAELPGLVIRQLHRRDLREHVSAASARDAAGRHR
jgi:pimeloyl-ACP methyl ester carboxylesterase